MIKSVTLPSSSSFQLEPNDNRLLTWPRSAAVSARRGSAKICCLSRNYDGIPKRNGFNRNSVDRFFEDLPIIEKTKKEIADYCTTLEGDPCYSCWMACFELDELERELPKEELETEITLAGGDGLQSMISSLHRSAAYYKRLKEESKGSTKVNEEKPKEESHGSTTTTKGLKEEKRKEEPKHVPEWMPKTLEELEEEEKARNADSPHARLLRAMRVYPAWYTHESD